MPSIRRPKRNVPINVFLSKEEKRALEALVRVEALSISDVVRRLIVRDARRQGLIENQPA